MKPTKTFFYNLDILRFIAFGGVFFSHIPFDTSNGFAKFMLHQGRLGVDLFFVISGFLITYLLIKEKEFFCTIDLFKFFTRRALRIYPLYFGFIILLTLLSIFFISGLNTDVLKNWTLYFVFLGNFDRVYSDMATINNFPGSGVLWSISVEEQFYLIIPLLLLFIKRSKYFLYSLLIIHFGTYLFRFFVIKSYPDFNLAYRTLYFHSIPQFSLISLGCILAYVAFYHHNFIHKIAQYLNPPKLFILVLMFFATNFLIYIVGSIYVEAVLGPEAFGLIFGLSLISICFNDQANKSPDNQVIRFINYLGKISYGLYIYHVPCLLVLEAAGIKSPSLLLVSGLALTIFTAHMSYKYFESSFINFKKKYAVIQTR